jgi:hypothetical protein
MNTASSLPTPTPPPPPLPPPKLLPASAANATSQRRGSTGAKTKQKQNYHDHESPDGSSSSSSSVHSPIQINNSYTKMNRGMHYTAAAAAAAATTRRSSPGRLLSPGDKNNASSSSNNSSNSSSTVRRLSDGEVRAIFECLHSERPVPTHLKFQIVPVGSNGLKLSPPSYEFQGKFVEILCYVCANCYTCRRYTTHNHILCIFFLSLSFLLRWIVCFAEAGQKESW